MKVMLFAVLDRGPITDELYNAIIMDGYNGTIIKTQSLKHLLHNEDFTNPAVLSLSQIAEHTHASGQNTAMFVIVEEEKLDKLQEDIRHYTENFTKVHGAMFVIPVESFEGSF